MEYTEYEAFTLLGAMKQNYENDRRTRFLFDGVTRKYPTPTGSPFAEVLPMLDGVPSTTVALVAVLFTHYLMDTAGPHEVGNFLDELTGLVTDVEPTTTDDGGTDQ